MAELESSWQSAGWMDELPGSAEPALPPPPPSPPAPSLAERVKTAVVKAEKAVEKAVSKASKAVKKAAKKAKSRAVARKVVRKVKKTVRKAKKSAKKAARKAKRRARTEGGPEDQADHEEGGPEGHADHQEGGAEGQEEREEGGPQGKAPLAYRCIPAPRLSWSRGVVYFMASHAPGPECRSTSWSCCSLRSPAIARHPTGSRWWVRRCSTAPPRSRRLDQVIIVRNDKIEAIGTRAEVDVPRRMRTVDLTRASSSCRG